MNDLPTNPAASVPTDEQQERIAAAIRAAGSVALDRLPIDEETAKLIALQPDCRRDDPEAVMKAAFATKMRNSRCWSARAAGVALGPDGKPLP